MSKTGTIDLTQPFVKSLVAKLDKAEAQRDLLLSAAKLMFEVIEREHWYTPRQREEMRAAIAAAEVEVS